MNVCMRASLYVFMILFEFVAFEKKSLTIKLETKIKSKTIAAQQKKK